MNALLLKKPKTVKEYDQMQNPQNVKLPGNMFWLCSCIMVITKCILQKR